MACNRTSGSGNKAPISKEVSYPVFDPAPSGHFAARALTATKVTGALIGRLAVWAWIPEESEHAFTKDLDIAISQADLPRIVEWLHQQGHEMRVLRIGGVNVKSSDGVNVDFITRAGEFGDLAPLFEDAILAAKESGRTANIGGHVLQVIPAEHLIAMKLATFEPEDELDAQRILEGADIDAQRLRTIVTRYLGALWRTKVENLLRKVGHPAAHPRGKYNGKVS